MGMNLPDYQQFDEEIIMKILNTNRVVFVYHTREFGGHYMAVVWYPMKGAI